MSQTQIPYSLMCWYTTIEKCVNKLIQTSISYQIRVVRREENFTHPKLPNQTKPFLIHAVVSGGFRGGATG